MSDVIRKNRIREGIREEWTVEYKAFVQLINERFRGVGIVCMTKGDLIYEATIGDITIKHYPLAGKTEMYHRIRFVGELDFGKVAQ